MRCITLRESLIWSAVVAVLVSLAAVDGRTIAQDRKASGKTATAKKERAKPRGRLPAYFAAVVTEEQRTKIYSVQARLNKEINDLRMQIEELIAERDREVDAVLSKDQLESVNKKREDAAKRRQMRSSKGSP